MQLSDIGTLLLGWLLGLLSPTIVNTVATRREMNLLKTTLFAELQEMQYRLLLLIFRIESKYGKLDKNFYEWAQSILINYKGVNSSESLIATLTPLLNLSNEDLQNYHELVKQKEKPNHGLELKKLTFSLLDSNIILLSKFDSVLQARLMEIKTHVGFLNEIVENSQYYFRLTFDSNITPSNYQAANNNLINSYNTYKTQARVIIEIINKVLNKA